MNGKTSHKDNLKSLGNPKLFLVKERNFMCNHLVVLTGLHNASYANVGGNYDNDANAGVFNVNVNNSSSNTNDNIGAHHQGSINRFALCNPCLLAEIHTDKPEISTESLVNSFEAGD